MSPAEGSLGKKLAVPSGLGAPAESANGVVPKVLTPPVYAPSPAIGFIDIIDIICCCGLTAVMRGLTSKGGIIDV